MKIIFNIAVIVLAIIGIILMIDVAMSGMHIMLFGIKLLFVPIAAIAMLYVMWHLMRGRK